MALVNIKIPGISRTPSVHESAFLSKVTATILDNLDNPFFGVTELAANVGMSSSQLSRRLKISTDYSPSRVIRHFRMEYAMLLLKETRMPIKEITQKTGFLEQANFCRTFKKHFQKNPSDLRSQHQAKTFSFEFHCQSPFRLEDLTYIFWLSTKNPWLSEVLERIIVNIHDESFGTEQLAEALSMSSPQLNRRLNILLKITSGRFIKNMRLQYASELLAYGQDPVATIAFKAGFFDHPHLSRSFKAAFGCSPKAYRQNKGSSPKPRFIQELHVMYKTDK